MVTIELNKTLPAAPILGPPPRSRRRPLDNTRQSGPDTDFGLDVSPKLEPALSHAEEQWKKQNEDLQAEIDRLQLQYEPQILQYEDENNLLRREIARIELQKDATMKENEILKKHLKKLQMQVIGCFTEIREATQVHQMYQNIHIGIDPASFI
jgi:hypothetical protein